MEPAVRAMGVLFAFTLAPLGSALAANDAAARVEAYLGPLRTLSAGFSQVVRNRDGDVVMAELERQQTRELRSSDAAIPARRRR